MNSRGTAAGIVLLMLVCTGVFGRVTGHAMLDWDDRVHVADNPWLQTIDAHNLAHLWRSQYGNLYNPVAYTVLGLEVAATKSLTGESSTAQINPALLHGMNVVLHTANAVLVFLLLVRLAGRTRPALLGALLFALHPLQVESVAWISEVRGLLAAAFALAAVLALCRVIDPRAPDTKLSRIGAYGLGLVLLCLALLSKPSAVTTPVVAAAVLWAGGVSVGRIARGVAPWLALSIVVAIVTARVQPADALGAAPALWQRPMVASDALSFYAVKLAWPAALAPDYGRTPAYVLQGVWPIASLVVVVTALGALVFLLRHSRLAFAGLAIVVASLLPVLGLVPFHHQVISTVADRYMYLALAGIGLIVSAAMAPVRSRVAWSAAFATTSLLGALALWQSAHWISDEALWRHNVAVVPRSAVAHNNLGRLLQHQGRLAEAEPLLVRALDIDGRSLLILMNLAELRVSQGRTADAEELYRRAIEAAPNSARAAVGLGVLLEQIGRRAEARAMFERAVAIDPKNLEALNNLGAILLREGDIEDGARSLEAVVAADPDHTQALFNLAMVDANAGRWLRAGERWQRAADAGMTGVDVRLRAGDAFARADDVSRAVRAYEAAAAEDPRAYEPLEKLGQLFMQRHRYGEAVAAFERALARAPQAAEPAAHLRDARRLSRP